MPEGRAGSTVGGEAPPARFDVVGLGNALVDVIAHAPEAFLERHGLVKGSMELIDDQRAFALYDALGTAVEMSGGSAANTMCGVASLGGRAAYLGKVSDDDLGLVFGHDLRAVGVAFPPTAPAEGVPTGRCVIVVTPDAQRTMSTYLGASSLLSVDDLSEETIAESAVVYMEGYLFDRDAAKAAFRQAAAVAHAHGRRVALTLSDSFCVERHRADFELLVRDDVDILFGNDDELRALYEVETLDEAIERARPHCELIAVTIGAAGSRIVTPDGIVDVPAEPAGRVLDTTGAGDLYAAGFLYGYTRQLSLAECGRIASIAAAEVISHVGPRPLVPLHTLI